MSASVGFCLLKILGDHRKLHPAGRAAQACTADTHVKHLPATSVHLVWYKPHPSTFGITTFPQISNNFVTLHNSQATIPLTPTSISKLQVFFKVKSYVYHSIYAILDYVTCKTVLPFLWVFCLFFYVIDEVFSVLCKPLFTHQHCIFFYCEIVYISHDF